MFIINFCLNMFRASLCPSSGEQRPCYCIWCVVLVLLDVVGSGCGALRCRMRVVLASYNDTSWDRTIDLPICRTTLCHRGPKYIVYMLQIYVREGKRLFGRLRRRRVMVCYRNRVLERLIHGFCLETAHCA